MSRSDYFPNLIFSLMQLWYLNSVRVGCQFFYSRNGIRLHVGETLDPDHVDVIFPLTWIRRKADLPTQSSVSDVQRSIHQCSVVEK